MAPDYRSDIIDQDILNAHLLTRQLCQILRFIQAVPMSDHNNIIIPSFRLLHGHINNLMDRFLTSALFSDDLKLSVIIHMDNRFNLNHSPQYGCCFGNAPSSLQMI